jgi:hypothetical protein
MMKEKMSLLEQTQIAEEERRQAATEANQFTKYETPEGVRVTAGQYQKMDEGAKTNLLESAQVAITNAEKQAMATIDVQDKVTARADMLSSKREFQTLQENGEIPEGVPFERWFSEKKVNQLMAGNKPPQEVYMKWFDSATKSYESLAETDPETSKKLHALYPDPAEAQAHYVSTLMAKAAENFNSTMAPMTPGQSGRQAGLQALRDEWLGKGDEQAIKDIAEEEGVDLNEAASTWMVMKKKLLGMGGKAGKYTQATPAPPPAAPAPPAAPQAPQGPSMLQSSPTFEGGNVIESSKKRSEAMTKDPSFLFGM